MPCLRTTRNLPYELAVGVILVWSSSYTDVTQRRRVGSAMRGHELLDNIFILLVRSQRGFDVYAMQNADFVGVRIRRHSVMILNLIEFDLMFSATTEQYISEWEHPLFESGERLQATV